ncbi:hypothetical protein [Streptomyces sp. 150FB]|uniref:hypothetical protein n=1 Tax=Streptomyces sp. 150FB TaxID=1576605 RepID=UPI000B12E20C|nr:hypothetical protein [Streptomyces sp. 150FB]
MATNPPDNPIGVAVLRVWWEPGSKPALRARLLVVNDAQEAPAEYATAAGIDDVCADIRSWLREWSELQPPQGG